MIDIRAWNRLIRLASPEGRRLLPAWLLLWEVDLWLRLAGFARLQAALSRPPRAAPPRGEAVELIEAARRMAQAILRASRYVPRARCLHRALALLLWLRRRGIQADLRLGVRSGAEAIEGHAWVEWNGVLLNDERSVYDTFVLLERPHGATAAPARRVTHTSPP